MKLGFIGTGVITEAIVTGLMRTDFPAARIVVSKRGVATSARLARAFDIVEVSGDNQEIVGCSDVVFLSVRPQDAESVLAPLRFDKTEQVVSLIATLTHAMLREWIGPKATITRAIPLPAVAGNAGVTAIYPRSDLPHTLFSALGSVVVAENLEEFDAIAAASALMGTYFGILEASARWLTGKGLKYEDSKTYLAALFEGLARTAVEKGEHSFDSLRVGHSTPGGLNQQLFEVFEKKGGLIALSSALDSVSERVRRAGQ